MARGGKRQGSGRKAVAGRVALLVRVDKAVEEQIEMERVRSGAKSLSATAERLLKAALATPQNEEDAAAKALGYVVAQAANAANSETRTWQNDPATTAALKLAIPAIIDHLAAHDRELAPHPVFKTAEQHAQTIYFWVVQMLKLRGDEYGGYDWPPDNPRTAWPADHPLRNFPKAALALKTNKETDDG